MDAKEIALEKRKRDDENVTVLVLNGEPVVALVKTSINYELHVPDNSEHAEACPHLDSNPCDITMISRPEDKTEEELARWEVEQLVTAANLPERVTNALI